MCVNRARWVCARATPATYSGLFVVYLAVSAATKAIMHFHPIWWKNLAPLAAPTQLLVPPSAAHAAHRIDYRHHKNVDAAEQPTGAAVAIAFDGMRAGPESASTIPRSC